MAKKPKWKIKVPHTYTLIIGFVILAAIATFIVPAGVYEMTKDPNTGRTLVDPNSFKFIEQDPVSIGDFLMSVPEGMVGAAKVIFLVFLVGGFFQVVNNTGAIDATINLTIRLLKDRALLVIPIIMLVMSVLGAVGIIVNAVIAFIPIGVALAKKLNLDPVVGISIMYLGAYSGFTPTPMGPFNTLLGQSIAGLPPLSGFAFRAVVWAIIYVITVWYTLRYAKKLRADRNNSVLGDFKWEDYTGSENEGIDKFKLRHALVMITLAAGFIIYAYGSFKLKWSLNEMSAMMFGVAIVSGIIARMHPDEMAKSFIEGCKHMVYGALVIGFAKAITIVLTKGKIIHSIIYFMSIPLTAMAPTFSAIGMFWANLIFNFFVPSGSGQAMIVMPLLAPLADVVGVTRQVAVSAYQYGDGFSNTIIPTSGVLMAVLGVAGVPYEKWLKYMIPLFLMWVAVGTIAVGLGAAIGWVG